MPRLFHLMTTCYDRDGKEVKRVTSDDEGNVEDDSNDNPNPNDNDNTSDNTGGGDNQGGGNGDDVVDGAHEG